MGGAEVARGGASHHIPVRDLIPMLIIVLVSQHIKVRFLYFWRFPHPPFPLAFYQRMVASSPA